jgi:hypothetical protein
MIKGFNVVGPHCMENSHGIVDKSRSTKHALCIVLVELLIFQVLPFHPIGSFDELTTGKFRHLCHDIVDATRNDGRDGGPIGAEVLCDGGEFQMIVQLVMMRLSKRCR